MSPKSSRTALAVVDRFAGWSDRDYPIQGTRIENPNLLNVDFSEGDATPRNGFTRQHTNVMRDASSRLDGIDDFARIPDATAYDFSNKGYVGFICVLNEFPESEVTLISRGYGTSTNCMVRFSYDPSINSGSGGWRCRVGSNNITVNDGDGQSPAKLHRYLELSHDSGSLYKLRVWSSSGSLVVESSTFTVSSFVSSAFGWTVGVSTTDGVTLGTDYGNFSIAEVRLCDSTSAAPSFAGDGAPARELTPTEISECVGYWKCNDGIGNTWEDSTDTSNDAVLGSEPPAWVTDQTEVVGKAGLEFFGESGHVAVELGGAGTTIFSPSGLARRWTVALVWTPRLDQGETSVRDQTILWSGNDPANPAPLGIAVEGSGGSQRIVMYYRDSGGLNTVLPITTLDLDGTIKDKRVRIRCSVYTTGGTEKMRIGAYVEGATQHEAVQDTSSGGTPTSVSEEWSIGRKWASGGSTFPYSFNDNSARCVVSDLTAWRHPSSSTNGFPPIYITLTDQTAFLEWDENMPSQFGFSALGGSPDVVTHISMNEGSGSILSATGSRTLDRIVLHPGQQGGVRWDVGLADPYTPVKASMIYDYVEIDSKGDQIRSKLVVSGCTMYKVSGNTATPVAADLHKGGAWSATQRDNAVYLANSSGYRPRRFNNNAVNWVGIDIPLDIADGSASTSGGSLADGLYNVYVTFRNSNTGTESNPGPPKALTVSGGGGSGALGSMVIPTSTDPQVNQRRVWCTVAGALAGTTAYLVETITDNANTTGSNITSVDITATQLEYNNNGIPPSGHSLLMNDDRLFVGGASSGPTKVYYSHTRGVIEGFSSTSFVEATLDQGDVITALKPLRGSVIAAFRDGGQAITGTDFVADPFLVDQMPLDAGPLNNNAVRTFEGGLVFMAERDIYWWNGTETLNLTSPTDVERTSIQTWLRDSVLQGSLAGSASMAFHRARRQFWFLFPISATQVETVIYDWQRGVWSRYDLDLDLVSEIEDSADSPWIYGVHEGFLVKLDDGDLDGHSLAVSGGAGSGGTVSGGTTTTLSDSSKTWTLNQFRGLTCWWIDVDGVAVYSDKIASNTTDGTLTFYSGGSGVAPEVGDPYLIGAIESWMEFNFNFGDPFAFKRLRWIQARGISDAANTIRVSISPDDLGRSMDFSNDTNKFITWASSDSHVQGILGGTGRNFRMRIGQAGTSAIDVGGDVIPPVTGRVRLQGFMLEAEELFHR